MYVCVSWIMQHINGFVKSVATRRNTDQRKTRAATQTWVKIRVQITRPGDEAGKTPTLDQACQPKHCSYHLTVRTILYVVQWMWCIHAVKPSLREKCKLQYRNLSINYINSVLSSCGSVRVSWFTKEDANVPTLSSIQYFDLIASLY